MKIDKMNYPGLDAVKLPSGQMTFKQAWLTLECEVVYANNALYKFLLSRGAVDEILPDATDIMDKWENVCMAYLHDGVREFNGYPTVSLGWMMFVGMAVAKFWDEDWESYSKIDNLYATIRDMRGYDNMDECVCEDLLGLDKDEEEKLSSLVADTATIAYNSLMREGFEPGTPVAFNAYVRCLHQLYYFGAAVELKRLGYHMREYPLN